MRGIIKSETNIENTCLIFGVFDGVHIGHRAVIERVMLSKRGLRTAAVIFENNLHQNNNSLYTIEEKTSIFTKLGFDIVYPLPFTKEIQNLPPDQFISQLLINRFHPKKIVAGENCKFGNAQSGSIDTLKTLSNKFFYDIETCGTIPYVSSKIIKEELEKANIKKATELLGHAYTITGKVVRGKALGRTVEMPTANILPYKNKFIPAQGVYATLTEISGKTYGGITNIGIRPSVDERDEITIENHIFNFDQDIYGHIISLKIYDYIRGIKKFSGIDEVKNQVTTDIQIVKRKLKAYL